MDYEETKSLKDKLLHKRTADDFGITILFFLLNLYWPAFTYSEDVFDQYPAFNSEMGIGKLTPEERSRLGRVNTNRVICAILRTWKSPTHSTA